MKRYFETNKNYHKGLEIVYSVIDLEQIEHIFMRKTRCPNPKYFTVDYTVHFKSGHKLTKQDSGQYETKRRGSRPLPGQTTGEKLLRAWQEYVGISINET